MEYNYISCGFFFMPLALDLFLQVAVFLIHSCSAVSCDFGVPMRGSELRAVQLSHLVFWKLHTFPSSFLTTQGIPFLSHPFSHEIDLYFGIISICILATNCLIHKMSINTLSTGGFLQKLTLVSSNLLCTWILKCLWSITHSLGLSACL